MGPGDDDSYGSWNRQAIAWREAQVAAKLRTVQRLSEGDRARSRVRVT